MPVNLTRSSSLINHSTDDGVTLYPDTIIRESLHQFALWQVLYFKQLRNCKLARQHILRLGIGLQVWLLAAYPQFEQTGLQ